ncbi:unnamed protein product [Pleuronectes platessa]|uniref:Uncharacterized protein n=1 Tax=Pleuronectes platessa TaxID=8262 RepID=A0A9N7VHE3_PLEPL|nr:unnamed protein product [Pleuronectes platessa]
MSIPTSFQGLRVSVDRGDKIGNKTQIQFPQTGDDNANRLSSIGDLGGRRLTKDTRYGTSSIPPLVSQSESPNKLVIWGSEQQCLETDLREFELVECQEIHTFLRNRDQEEENEEEDDGGSLRDGRDEGPMSISSSSTASSSSVGMRRNDNDSNKVERRMQRDKGGQKIIASHSTEELDTCVAGSTGRGKGGLKESKSETNVFVSSLSAIALSGSLSSALDCTGEAPSPISLCHPKTHPYPNVNNATSAHTRRRAVPADVNQNSASLHPQEIYDYPQFCSQDQRQGDGSHHRNAMSSNVGLGERRRAGFEERVLPPRRQQLSRQPNQAAQREEVPVERTPVAATRLSSSPPNHSTLEKRPETQFTYRRNCSSPNRTGMESRSSTPPHSPLRTSKGSPRRQPSVYHVSRNVSGVIRHVPSGCNPAVPTSAQGYGNSCLRAPVRTNISTSGIPKAPPNNQQSSPHSNYNPSPRESSPSPKLKPKGVRPKIITYVRKNPQFKPQAADGPYQVSSLPSRLSTYAHGQAPNSFKDNAKDPSKPETEPRAAPVLMASNPLYDKYRQDMQTSMFPPGVVSRSIRPPGHANTVPPAHTHAPPHVHPHSHTAPPKLGCKADNFYGAPSEVGRSGSFKGTSVEDTLQPRTAPQAGGSGSLLRSGRGLRLGLGAVNRAATDAAKGRGPGQGQRSALVFSQPVQPVIPATSQRSQDNTDEVFTQHTPLPAPAMAAAQSQSAGVRSLLPKASQSGLRPPGFNSSRHPAGRLAAFGFVRSSSVSSVSSAHSADSSQSDPCRTAHSLQYAGHLSMVDPASYLIPAGFGSGYPCDPQRISGLSVSEEPPLHRVTTSPPSADHQRGAPCRSHSLQPPSTPALPRRYLPAQPRSSPGVGRKEFQRSSEVTRSLPSSPKRLAVVPPKPQSPVQSGQRPAAAVRGSAPPGSPLRVAPLRLQQEQQESLQREKEEAQQKEKERQAEERDKEEQREEVQRLQGRCEQQERQLRTLRDELRKTSLGLEAFIITTQHYCLKNKTTEENERKLSMEMQKIREEMASNSVRWERLYREKMALEVAFERELQELQLQQEAELAAVEEGLRKGHSAEAEHLKAEHCSEMVELRTHQQEQVEEMAVHHQATVQELRDMHNITMATLHEEHARTMRDLRKAHEQQKMLLEEDFEKLRLSLQDQVDTLTFQNQSLRDKAKRFEDALRRSTDEQIVDALAPYQHIEKDLKSLKEIVEMKNQQIHQQEKKISDLEKVAQKNVFLEEKVQVLQQQNEDMKTRIDMNLVMSRQLSEENANLHDSVEKESTEKKRLSMNNEELLWRLQTSPLMSPASSPLHRSFSTSPVPSSQFFSSSPVAGCDSPTHCHGCPKLVQYSSPAHRVTTNQNLSPGPATPTHRAASNQNYSPGPATPTHRGSANRCNLAAR